jgi:ribose 5-phosphate isomerase B
MKLVVASDERTHLTDSVVRYLEEKGHELLLLGDLVEKNGKWAEIGKEAAQKVAAGAVDQGIIFCWSGTGICMAANRIRGVRAALCWDAETAKLAKKWDDANMLCMSLRYTSQELAKEILEAWFSTKFDEEGLNEAHKLDE